MISSPPLSFDRLPHRFASFDLGSNSTLCLLLERPHEGPPRVLEDLSILTGLGRGLVPGGPLRPEAKQRLLSALRIMRSRMDALDISEGIALTTAAMREASDGPSFARELEALLGVPVLIISGEEEASLTFLGQAWGGLPPGPMMLIDVGGRSTELLVGTLGDEHSPGTLHGRVSLPLGAISGTERLLVGDPVSAESVQKLRALVRQLLEQVPFQPQGERLVGVAGTSLTLGAMGRGHEGQSWEEVDLHGSALRQETLEQVIEELQRRRIVERMAMPGLPAERAELVLGGAVVLSEGLRWSGAREVLLSNWGLRHGGVWRLAGLLGSR